MDTLHVKHELRSDYALLTIDRLDHRNRLNEAALRQLRDGVIASQRDGAAMIVITGAGELFCTGGAVDGYPDEFSVERHQSYSRAFVDLLIELGRATVPIVARVNGDCLAGGTMILHRCDLAVSVDTARFGLPELAFGGFPTMALATAIEQFPAKLVFDMAYLGRTLDAKEALDLHLVNRVCSAQDLDAEIDTIAAQLRQRSAPAISYGRRTFYSLLRTQTETRLEQSRTELTVSAASQAVRDAARAP